MELQRWIQVLCILPALQDLMNFRANSMQCRSTHYFTTDRGTERCCIMCDAGKRLRKHCEVGKENSTVCVPCPKRTFQASANSNRDCTPCLKQSKSHRKLLRECSATNDKEYGECYEGYYQDLGLDSCRDCKRCSIGYGVKKQCTNISNTECEEEPCAEGTYSDIESQTQTCQPCTLCNEDEEIIQNCTQNQNQKCRSKSFTTRGTTTSTITSTNINSLTSKHNTTTKSEADNTSTGPSIAGRENGANWVIPFFITSMILLLVLFVVFVVGVIIWCHIQSRHRRQHMMMQSVDQKVLQRLGRSADDVDSGCLITGEESPFLCEEMPNDKRGKIQENGLMIRDVTHDVIEQLANFLNPTNPPSNWRKVASMLDFPWSVINNLALCPTTATQQLLERWGTKRDATVYKLYLTLKDIGRDDAAEVLERLLMQPVPSCPKSV